MSISVCRYVCVYSYNWICNCIPAYAPIGMHTYISTLYFAHFMYLSPLIIIIIIIIYIVPDKSDYIIPKVLHMVHYYYPSSGQPLCHSFVRGRHLPSQLAGEHTGHKAASRCSEPIWNAHNSFICHYYQVPILNLGEVRHT